MVIFEGKKTCRQLANRHDIDYSEKEKMAPGFICPFTGAIFHTIQTCLLVYTADPRCAFTRDVQHGPTSLCI